MLEGSKRVAVIGVAKNCGKTTTLNALSALAHAQGRIVGVASVGIDGETQDVLLGTAKPPVHVLAGQLLVSTTKVLQEATAQLEYVQDLGIETPLGATVAARVVQDGEAMLAGLRHRSDLIKAAQVMESEGADLILIDGAYGRVVAAHSDITDGIVVSTGAVISPSAARIAEKTSALLERLALPAIEIAWQRALMKEAADQGQALFGGPDVDPKPLPAQSALVGLPRAREQWTPEIHALAVPGLVSDRVVNELIRFGGTGRTLLVPDGTVVQCDHKLLAKLLKRFEVRVLSRSPVIGIAINPTSVQGHRVDETAILHHLAARWPNIPIFNPHVALESP